MNIRSASFCPGSREPQLRQNQVSHCESGLAHWAMCSLPCVHLNRSFGTRTTATPFAPVARRQIEQWQMKTPSGAPSKSKLTDPQLQCPVIIVLPRRQCVELASQPVVSGRKTRGKAWAVEPMARNRSGLPRGGDTAAPSRASRKPG